MEEQTGEKQKRRKAANSKAKCGANVPEVDDSAKLVHATNVALVASNGAFDASVAFNAQQQVNNSKVAQLPNVSQILNVPNETQTMSMNGAQPLPPISTVAGRFSNPNFPNLGAFPGLGLPNLTNLALPAAPGAPPSDTEPKQGMEGDPSSIPIGVVSVPNLNFVPFHMGEMSLFADSSGSVCAAPSGFHMPFHVPFSGIISIPSAVLTTPMDGAAPPNASDVKLDGTHPLGMQLGNAQALLSNAHAQTLFAGGQSQALFGTQLPTFAAAFVSQPFAFLGPPHPGCGQQQPPVSVSVSVSGAVDTPVEASLAVEKEPEEPCGADDKKKRKRRAPSQAAAQTQMSSLDEVLAQLDFSDSAALAHDKQSAPPAPAKKPARVRKGKKAKELKQPNQPARNATGATGACDGDKLGATYESPKAKRSKTKRARRDTNAKQADLANPVAASDKPCSSLDDEILELLRSVVEADEQEQEQQQQQQAATAVACTSNARPKAVQARQNAAKKSCKPNPVTKPDRPTLTDSQRSALQTAFSQSCRLSKERASELAAQIGVEDAVVSRYFSSTRRRLSKQQKCSAAVAIDNHVSATSISKSNFDVSVSASVSVTPTTTTPVTSRTPKRRPLRGTNGPITNFMTNLNSQFFDDIIEDTALQNNAKSNAKFPSDCQSTAPMSVHTCSTPGDCIRSQTVGTKCDDENENVNDLCATDISAMLANVLPNGADADADADLPADIVLPTIDTSLLPALDNANSINILSAATAMLPTADDLNTLNLDLAVCSSDTVKQSG